MLELKFKEILLPKNVAHFSLLRILFHILQLKDDTNEKKNLKFLRSTVMNPFQSSNGFVERIAAIFRRTVLNCIAKVRHSLETKQNTNSVTIDGALIQSYRDRGTGDVWRDRSSPYTDYYAFTNPRIFSPSLSSLFC